MKLGEQQRRTFVVFVGRICVIYVAKILRNLNLKGAKTLIDFRGRNELTKKLVEAATNHNG